MIRAARPASRARRVVFVSALVAPLAVAVGGASAAVTFAPKQDIAAGSGPASIAIGDFNRDRKPDLAVANQRTPGGAVSILLGAGNGSFGGPASIATPAGQNPNAVAAGDVNGDGKQDLVVMDALGGTFSSTDTYGSVLLGDGAGSFAGSAVLIASGLGYAYSVAVGDVNGDGKQDIVAAGLRPRSGGAAPVGLIASRLGDGTGAFPSGDSTSGGDVRRSLAVGDLNGDGKLDLVTANSGREDFPGTATAFLGDGANAFNPSSSPDTGTGSTSVALGDFNGDRKADMAVANYGSDDVTVLLGNGAGAFSPAGAFPAHDGPRALAVGDFDGDGRKDLAVANAVSRDVSVLAGTGSGAFGAPVHFAIGEMTTLAASRSHGDGGRVAVGDFDCNGTHDLAVANDASGTVSILMNARSGTAPAGCRPDTTGPAVRILSTSLRLSSAGSIAVKLQCPAGEPAGCASTVRIRTASKVRVSRSRTRIVTLGSRTITLRAGRTTTVRIKLSRANRSLVRKLRRVRVKVSVTARDQARNGRTTTKTLTLRRS